MAGKEEKIDYQLKTVELLEELLKWIKFSSMPQVKQVLLSILDTDEKKIAYQLSDGRPSGETATLANVDGSTVRDWGKIWVKAHIAEFKPVRGGERAVRLFSLEEFGIETLKSKTPKPPKQEIENTQNNINSTEEKKE